MAVAIAAITVVVLAACEPGPSVRPGTYLYFNMCGNPHSTWCYQDGDQARTGVVAYLKAENPVALAVNEICISQFDAIKAASGFNGQFVQAGSAQCSTGGTGEGSGAYGIAVFYRGAQVGSRIAVPYVAQVSGSSEKRMLLCVHLPGRETYAVCTTHLASGSANKAVRDAQTKELVTKLNGLGQPYLAMGDLNQAGFGSAVPPTGAAVFTDNVYISAAWRGPWNKAGATLTTRPAWTDHPGIRFRSAD